MIFVFFKPLDIKKQKFSELPLFEIKHFILYELDLDGLKTSMTGESALKYVNRYIVKNINFKDNSQKYISGMTANYGRYEDDIVYLDGNVSYKREDGFSFISQYVIYNKKTSIVKSDEKYVAYMGKNSMIGSSIEYNMLLNTMNAKNIEIDYKLEARQ